MNERYSLLAGSAAVDQVIADMAHSILRDVPTAPLFVALLRGAAPFASKLMFEMTKQQPEFHPEIDYMMVSTYGENREASQPVIITGLAPSTSVKGRTVIVLDDVLDKGITADFVFSHLRSLGAEQIKLAVLCDKQTAREKDIEADYAGFTFADNWLVGMGMDDANAANEGYRWLDEIWEVNG